MAFLRDAFNRERLGSNTQLQRRDIPTDQVAKLRRQGLSNDQIIQILQRDGYTLDLINNAIAMVDAKESVRPFTIGEGGHMQEPFTFPEPQPMPGQMPMYQESPSSASDEKIQEIAEAIIEEKWNELVQNVTKVVEWKSGVEQQITKLEQQMANLKENFDRLHSGVLEKLGDYDKGIKDVGTEIRALEKVFQKILPGFVDNVQELSRVAQTMRRIVPPKK